MEVSPASVGAAHPAAEIAARARLAGRSRDRRTGGSDQRTVRCRIRCLLLGIRAWRFLSHKGRRRGTLMRYGCYHLPAPALLAGGVVACPEGGLLVSPAGFADAVPPLHLSAVDRAVTLASVAAAADDHQAVTPRAMEHPVTLLDGPAPATEDWTQCPPSTILSLNVRVIALAVTQKPKPFA